ncbi:MAG: 5-bromo-4-chloroindolyl phosphate hydrolysis protein, partial [Terrisporobacter sp.]
MNKKDFSDLEDQIMSTVDNALKAIDFANLKRNINDKTDDTLNKFKSKFNGYSEKYMSLNKKSKNHVSTYISKKPSGNVSSILYIVFGLGGSLIYGSSLLIFLIFKMLFNGVAIIGSSIMFGVA